MLEHALVDGAGTEAAAHEQYGLLGGVEAETLDSLFAAERGLDEVLAHGVAREYDFVGGEEAVHVFIGHAYLLGLLGQQTVGHSGIRVLLLDEAGYMLGGTHVERGTAGITSYAHGCHGAEIADNLLCHALALPYLEEYGNVAQRVLAVESADRQALYLIACGRHALHLHASQCTHKEYLGIGALGLDAVGYRDGGKYVSAGTSSTDDDSQFVFHFRFRYFIQAKIAKIF